MNNDQSYESLVSCVKKAKRSEVLTAWGYVLNTPAPDEPLAVLRAKFILQLRNERSEVVNQKLYKKLQGLYLKFKENPDYMPSGKIAQMREGVKLVREYRGKIYEVTALDKGYLYKGEVYSSLSKIAKIITGTHWNGKVWFGVKS
mgnify:CR=1 FL=1